jgi:hypothetical protein
VSFNLIVWKWSAEYDTGAKRRRLGVKYPDIAGSFMENESHPAMLEHDFSAFESDVVAAFGPEQDDGPYILERHACARVFHLPVSQVPALVSQIGDLARKHGLTSAQG